MNLNLYDQEKFVKEGGKTQEIVWVEELGELQHEITKSLRGNLRKEHLIEELADVLICIEQLRIKYNISEEQLQKWIDVKHNRNCNRLEQKKLRDDKYKGTETCSGVNDCDECPLYNIGCGESFNAFEMIEAVEKWSKEHQPKKFKVSQLEYDILKAFSECGFDNFHWLDKDKLLMSLLRKGYFKGATKDMSINYYLDNCEVKEDV